MKNIQCELEKSVMERFRQHAIVKSFEEKICSHAKRNVYNKYKGTKIKRGNLLYELFDVQCRNESNSWDAIPTGIQTTLIYIITSKITASQKKKLENAKSTLNAHKWMPYCNDKTKLWIEESYSLTFKDIESEDKVNLRIDGKC